MNRNRGTGVLRDEMTVAEMVRGAASGDANAWNALVDHFANMVWSIARVHRLDAADAADVSQTTWMRLVDHIDKIEQPERVGAWLATTARRESLRVLRLAGRQIPVGDEALLDVHAVESAPVDNELIVEERDRVLAELMDRLSCRCQLILRLLLADTPLSYRDLSDALEMPIGSIGPTRARCLDHLRRLAAAKGLQLNDGLV